MSKIVGQTTPFISVSQSADRRLDWWFGPAPLDALWPRSNVVGGAVAAIRYEMPRVLASGRRGDKLISLIAVDSSGAVMAGATIKAFRTSDDVANSLVGDTQEGPDVISQADGAFVMPVPNADPHYLVGYEAGSPDVAGTSVNTLIGS